MVSVSAAFSPAGAIHPGNPGTYASGSVSGGNQVSVGGLVGENVGRVSTSYSSGAVSAGANSYVGGLVGEGGGNLNYSYASGTVSGGAGSQIGLLIPNYDLLGTAAAKSPAQLQSGTLPAGFDPTVWSATPGQYPTLLGLVNQNPPPTLSANAAAALSNLAYLSANAILSGGLPAGYPVPDGYAVLVDSHGMPYEYFGTGDAAGLHAIAFRGPNGITIALRGTTGIPGLFSQIGFADTGFSGQNTLALSAYLLQASNFLATIQGVANSQGLSINLVGHSLGGGIAELLSRL